MKQLRPLSVLFAAVLCCWSVTASACDQEKASATSASTASMSKSSAGSSCSAHGVKTTAMTASTAGATCTPEMMAACASAKAAGTKMECSMGSKSAMTAATMGGADCCAGKSAAKKASMKASIPGNARYDAATISMSGGSCEGKDAKSASMAGGSSAARGAKSASMTAGSCAAHGAKTTAMTAGSTHSCGGANAMAAGGQACASKAGVIGARHAGCSFCDDLSACDQEMRSLGAISQIVPLKNGVMFVYTGDVSKVRAVQSAMARRKDQMAVFASNDSREHLCTECKALRGAAASGKLSREVVNIDSGCLTLMTSSDPTVVARIHELAGVPTNRIKS